MLGSLRFVGSLDEDYSKYILMHSTCGYKKQILSFIVKVGIQPQNVIIPRVKYFLA